MAFDAQRDHADISLVMKTNLGPRKRISYFSILLIYVGMILTQRPSLLKIARFEEGVEPLYVRSKMQQTRMIFSYIRTLPEVPCLTTPPRTAFLCIVNSNSPNHQRTYFLRSPRPSRQIRIFIRLKY